MGKVRKVSRISRIRITGALLLFFASSLGLACPDGQHSECVMPKLFGGGCAQSICVPTVKIEDPIGQVMRQLQGEANNLAMSAKSDHKDYDDCIPIVAAGVAAAGAKLGAAGGPWGAAAGAALGAGGGVNMARIACRRAFGKGDDQ